MLRLFDSHCHLDLPPLSEHMEQVKADARQQGVAQVLVPAVEWAGFDRVLALKQADPDWIRIGLGLHPWFFAHHQPEHLQQLEQYLSSYRHLICALGEIGLDWTVEGADREAQIGYLEYQLKLAKQYQLPVVIHVRKAHPEVQQLLRRYGPLPEGGVIHGFSGGPELAKSYLDLGMKLGIGATITYPRGSKTRTTLARLPLDSFVLETDAPSMPVYGYQGRHNEPKRLSLIFEALCACRNESLNQIQAVLWQTSDSLFTQAGRSR